MPNPSAKYEADGAGGIVNIVLKNNASLGLSGSLGLTAGTRGETGGFGNLAYQEGRLTLFGNASLNFSDQDNTLYNRRQNLLAEPTTFLELDGRSGNEGRFSRGALTAELQVAKKSTVWLSFSGGGYGFDSEGTTAYTLMDEARAPTERYDRVTTSDWRQSQLDGSLGFKHVVEEGKHEFSVEVRRSHSGGDNDGRYLKRLADLEGDPLDLPPELMINDTDQDETRTWLKADYERPLGETLVEIGYQANLQTTSNDQLRESYSTASATTPVSSLQDAFRYDETFHQAYLSASRRFGKLSLQAGVRAEQAHTEFRLPTTAEHFDNDYTSLFPNANLSYDLGHGRRLGLNYSRRIQRPWVWLLNPVDPSTDPLTHHVGNPHLKPQYTHSFGGSLSWSGQKGTLRLSPYYRLTEDDWGQITHADSAGVLTTTWQNVASIKSYDFQTRDRTVVQIARNEWSMRSATLSISYNFGHRPKSVRRPEGEEGPRMPQGMGPPQ